VNCFFILYLCCKKIKKMLIDARAAADMRPPEVNKGRRRRKVQLDPDKQTAKT
jgi:hypothetical protein